jgi:PBP1b-binding outer membrane lipoprotein LpoB
MKKIVSTLCISALLAACNNSADSVSEQKDSLDSVAKAHKENIDSTNEASKDMIDSASKELKQNVDSNIDAKKQALDSTKPHK